MKLLNLILITLISRFLYGCGEKKYTVYTCPTAGDSEKCSDNCKSNSKLSLQYSFISDEKSKSIMMVAYNDVQLGSVLKENCKIFSNKTWDCSESHPNGTNTFKMANGIFSSYTSNLIESPAMPNNGICAK
jgi:hypothetical protein